MRQRSGRDRIAGRNDVWMIRTAPQIATADADDDTGRPMIRQIRRNARLFIREQPFDPMKIDCLIRTDRETSMSVTQPGHELSRIYLRHPYQVGIAIAVDIARNQSPGIRHSGVE